MKTYWKLLLLLCLVLLPDITGAQNLIRNGNFSNGVTDWSGTAILGPDTAYENAYGGSSSTNIVTDVNDFYSIYQDVCVVPNTSYTLTFLASRAITFWAAATVITQLTVTSYDASGAVIATIINPTFSRNNTTYNATAETYTINVPNNTAIKRIRVSFTDATSSSILQGMVLDNISLTSPYTISPVNFCQGQAQSFVLSGGGTPSSYSWAFNGGGAAPATSATASPSVTWSSAGAKTVQLTIGNGTCTLNATFTANVTVTAAPVISNQTASICSGTAFNVSPAGAPAGTTYTWAAPVIAPSGTITGASAQPLGQSSVSQALTASNGTVNRTATYTVTPQANGCTGSTFTVTVTVGPSPNGAITAATTPICEGQQGQLSFNASSGVGPYSLTINGQVYNNISSLTPFNVTPNLSATTAYTLTQIKDANNCTNP